MVQYKISGKDGRDCRPLEIATDKEVIDYLIDYQLKGATDIESIETVYRASCPKLPYIVTVKTGRLKDVQIFIESGTIQDINRKIAMVVIADHWKSQPTKK